jgi:prevent-host-death family protein
MIWYDYKHCSRKWVFLVGETIRPSADLRNHYNEISKQCRESREAVIITVNGRGDTAVLGLQDYYQMKSELELLRTLAEAEEDVKNGRVAPMQNTFEDIRSALRERQDG